MNEHRIRGQLFEISNLEVASRHVNTYVLSAFEKPFQVYLLMIAHSSPQFIEPINGGEMIPESFWISFPQ